VAWALNSLVLHASSFVEPRRIASSRTPGVSAETGGSRAVRPGRRMLCQPSRPPVSTFHTCARRFSSASISAWRAVTPRAPAFTPELAVQPCRPSLKAIETRFALAGVAEPIGLAAPEMAAAIGQIELRRHPVGTRAYEPPAPPAILLPGCVIPSMIEQPSRSLRTALHLGGPHRLGNLHSQPTDRLGQPVAGQVDTVSPEKLTRNPGLHLVGPVPDRIVIAGARTRPERSRRPRPSRSCGPRHRTVA
jgi:hypothetical protein